MANHNSILKIITLLGIFALSLIYAWPNLYREFPVVEISSATSLPMEQIQTQVIDVLKRNALAYGNVQRTEAQSIQVRFKNTDEQLHAKDVLQKALGDDFNVALNLVSAMPNAFRKIGANPMKLGLDLKGGVHFLLDVDMQPVIKRHYEDLQKQVGQLLREKHFYYSGMRYQPHQGLLIRLREPEMSKEIIDYLQLQFSTVTATFDETHGWLQLKLNIADLHDLRQATIEQTMSILRNRVNELGVAEAVVQQQGEHRIAVDLPGIQDAARAKSILGGTATLEFHMVDEQHDATLAEKTGVVPSASLLFNLNGRPLLLKKEVVLNGDAITSATSSFDDQTGSPSVSVSISSGSEQVFSKVTRENIGHHMAILYVETKSEEIIVDGHSERLLKRHERVISAPVIQSALGRNFQINGLADQKEASKLAILLRSGALPTAIFTVEERTIGPSLGQENIHAGMMSLVVGMAIVLVLMLVYYQVFGLIADLALALNLVFLVSLLSIIGATLTLPGIAGIVLTLGMAVDANVLINERIREELRNGLSVQAAIRAGYERAFATILDANVTSFIVGLILFSLGAGPVRGFAITLCLGLITSMISGVTYSRAMVNAIYGHRKVQKLSIGI
jgi:preprotein translocase subunit SecD